MRLAWERPGVVRMTVKVAELAALIAGARVAARALAGEPGEPAEELARLVHGFDQASRQLQATSPSFFNESSRSLQRRFGTEVLAGRIVDRFVKDHLEDSDRAFIERADMFFLATADRHGRPTCSYKGGDPGFVTVIDERTIAFPSYDGNGMYLSWGNVADNPEVGLLFLDLERGHRLRCHGTATLEESGAPGQLMVRVQIRDVFPNCPRYIHRYTKVAASPYVPRPGQTPPVPDWKKEPWAAEVLEKGDIDE